MQCCAAVQATYKKQQTPQLWMEGRGELQRTKKIPTPTLFEYNVSTILSPIVGVKSDSYSSVCEWNPLE